jgi:hypothetical protein
VFNGTAYRLRPTTKVITRRIIVALLSPLVRPNQSLSFDRNSFFICNAVRQCNINLFFEKYDQNG